MKAKKNLPVTLLIAIVLGPIPSLTFCQPAIEWERTYGGTGNDYASSLVQCADGGFVVVGGTNSHNGDVHGLHGTAAQTATADGWIVKTDRDGALEWTSTSGGSNDDTFSSVVQAPDGGFVAVGWTSSSDGDLSKNNGYADVFVVKFSPLGSVEWSRSYGGSLPDWGHSICKTPDGGFIVSGGTTSSDGDFGDSALGRRGENLLVFKIDGQGRVVWYRVFGGFGDEFQTGPESIVYTDDGGCAVIGSADCTNGDVSGVHGLPIGAEVLDDIWLVKLDTEGSIQWQKCYGGVGMEIGYGVIQTHDGGYAIVGTAASHDGDVTGVHDQSIYSTGDMWVVRTDRRGSLIWEKSVGGTNPDFGESIVECPDRGLVIAGQTGSIDGDVSGRRSPNGDDWWVFELDSDGAQVWQKCFGGTAEDILGSIVSTLDGGLAIAGYTYSDDGDVTGLHSKDTSDFWVVKLAGIPCNDIRVSIPQAAVHARNQDTVRLPIIALDTSARPLSVFDFSLKLNTDLLTPIKVDTKSGQFAEATVERFDVHRDSVSIRLRSPQAIKLRVDTLCILECIPFVTDTLSTTVSLNRVAFADPPFSSGCLNALAVSSPDSAFTFTLIPSCGETELSSEMRPNGLLSIASVSPNPTSSRLTISLNVPPGYQNDGVLEVYDDLGNLLDHRWLVFQGTSSAQTVELSLTGHSGVRYVRVSSANGVSTRRVVVRR